VIVTPYTPDVVEVKVHDAVAGEGGSVTLAGQVTVRPVDGVTEGVSVTAPLNAPTALTVTVVDAPVVPVLKFTGPVAEMVKSETETDVTIAVNLIDLDAVPTPPLTVIV
jgi:hypothetical protein